MSKPVAHVGDVHPGHLEQARAALTSQVMQVQPGDPGAPTLPPLEREDLAAATPGLERRLDDRPQVRAGGVEQAPLLIAFEPALARLFGLPIEPNDRHAVPHERADVGEAVLDRERVREAVRFLQEVLESYERDDAPTAWAEGAGPCRSTSQTRRTTR